MKELHRRPNQYCRQHMLSSIAGQLPRLTVSMLVLGVYACLLCNACVVVCCVLQGPGGKMSSSSESSAVFVTDTPKQVGSRLDS